MDVRERFLLDNEMLVESPKECDLKVGDIVTFTNEFGISFTNNIVIGFAKPENELYGRFIHLDNDSAWFPVERESLTLESKRDLERIAVVYGDGTTIHFQKIVTDTD